MSHIEMNRNSVLKCALAALFSIAPAISRAAIPSTYFPAYSFQLAQYETTPAPLATEVVQISSVEHKSVIRHKRTPSSINRAALMVATPSKVFYGENGKSLSPDLIANFNQIKANEKPIDMTQLIPLDMQPSDNSGKVFSQVADKSLSTFFKSKTVRESTLGQAATQVEQKMKQEVVISGDDPMAIQHKLNFSLQAFQALAQVQYSGLTNAALKYKIAEHKMALEVFEKIYGNKNMVLSHTVASNEQITEVGMRWTF